MATGGGGMNLGGAQFTITANTAQFTQGMQQAGQQATQTTTQIVSAFAGLQIIPRQLAAINQSIVNLGNNMAGLQRQANALRSTGGGGGMFGGMGQGLLTLSQTIDDIQYGFSAIVNNIPQLGMGLGSALGMSTQQAMALGGAMGIVAVAINQIATHWDEWFGEAKQLPTLTQDVEQLGHAMKKINSEIGDLIDKQEAASEKTGAGNLWGLTKEKFTAADEERMGKLKELQGEARKRIREEKDLEATGPEHTNEAREVGGRVREAIGGLPEGSDTLMGILQARGMTREQAREAISQAQRGHTGHLNDIIGNLTEDEKKRGPLSGLAKAMPRAIEAERHQKIDEQMQEHDRKEAEKRIREDKAAKHKEDTRNENYDHRQKMRNLEDSRMLFQEDMEREQKSKSKPFKGSYFEYATSHGESFGEKRRNEKLDAIKGAVKDVEKAIKEERRRHEDVMARLAD